MPAGAEFKIWLAADAFLFMPIYALKHFGILEKVAQANNRSVSIDIETPEGLAAEAGDEGAARRMLRESKDDRSVINISVGDPLQALKPLRSEYDTHSYPSALQNLRVIAALIKKPPFWLAGNGHIGDVDADGDMFIFYKEHLGTGHELGLKIAREYNLPRHRWDCPNENFGNELDSLFREPDTQDTRLVLSADVMGVARSRMKDVPGLNLVEPIPVEDVVEIGSFLTTGLCADKWHLRHRRQELMIFLKALSISCGMFATSEKAISLLATELSRDNRFCSQFILDQADEDKEQRRSLTSSRARLEQGPANWLAERIVERSVYSPDLTFEYADWRGSVGLISDQGISNFSAWRGASRRFLRLRYLSNVDLSLASLACRAPGLRIPNSWEHKLSRLLSTLSVVAFSAAWATLFIFGPTANWLGLSIIAVGIVSSSLAIAPVFQAVRFGATLIITGDYLYRHSVVVGGFMLMLVLIALNAIGTFVDQELDFWGKIRNISITVMSSIGIVYGSYVAQFLPRRRDD